MPRHGIVNFAALFETLATDPDSYLRNDPATFAAAIGRSYYVQIVPTSSVALGWSSWAVQWLSRTPAEIPDQVQVAYSRDPIARSAFAKQAAEGWQEFLSMRSRELSPGGRLVVLAMATDDAGDFGYRPLLVAIYATLSDMVDEGLLRAEELRRMTIPTVARSRAEFADPFAKSGRFEDLTIEQLEVFYGEDRIWAQFETNGDAQAFGAQWAAFSRASVFPTLAASLSRGADVPRFAKFVDRLEAGVAARLSASPERMKIPLAQMLILKGSASR